MRYSLKLLTLAFSFVLMGAAFSAPSLLGPTGLMIVPTSDTAAKDSYSIGTFVSTDSNLGFALNYGAQPNLEVGFTRLPGETTIVNAKYRFFQESEEHVGVAVGLLDATDQVNTSLYVVASTPFSIGDLYGIDNFHANLGISTGDEDHNPVPPNGLFGGISFDVAEKATVMVEHDGSNLNVGVRGDIGKGFLGTLGVVDSELTVGVTYIH